MRVLGLAMRLVKPGDDLPRLILQAAEQVGGLKDGDVLVIASKVSRQPKAGLENLREFAPLHVQRKLRPEADNRLSL